jgi:hypothetical protein
LSKGKKQDIASFSMPMAMQEKLKRVKEKKGIKSVSKLVRDLVDRYVIEDDDVVPVVLKVPAQLKGNPQALRQWLDNRIPNVVAALSQPEKVEKSEESDEE